MPKQEIFINGRSHTLLPSQLIQSGGEGMVFRVGQTAVKRYRNPQPAHVGKLRYFIDKGVAGRLPTHIFAPQSFAFDKKGAVVGFQMRLLPSGSAPLKKLASPLFWRKNDLATTAVIPLFQAIRRDLAALHDQNVVVGDLNDQNLFFTPAAFAPSWVDVDSCQLGGFPCPVAMIAFLDPTLYGVDDFGKRPYFTPMTDWYAYTVLLVKSLLQTHPYGGAHKLHKSLQARATARISVFNSAVVYPKNGRSPDTLSDDLLHHLHLIFEKGERRPFPVDLLQAYADDLTTCAACNSAYPRGRARCPSCRASYKIIKPSPAPNSVPQIDGVVVDMAIRSNGRYHFIVRQGALYKRIRAGAGGILDEMALFEGAMGYRAKQFGDCVAVNPPNGAQLLILDLHGRQPRKITMLETALFRETAVFAASPHYLYRIAGDWIMRGEARDGLYVEDAIATAHRGQTRFWGSPHADLIAGYHRIFAENRFFAVNAGANRELAVRPLAAGESLREVNVAFAPQTITFTLTIRAGSQIRQEQTVIDSV